MEKISHFIDGKKFSSKNSRTGAIFNPALGEQIAEVELASEEIVKIATENAAKAFNNWLYSLLNNAAVIVSPSEIVLCLVYV